MDASTARALSLDEFAAWMLSSQRYNVDPTNGRVWNTRTGRFLTAIKKRGGYLVVNLVFDRSVVRQVKVHRLVAIKVHGVDTVKGKQVAHLDRVASNNSISNLWVAPSARDHVKYDGTDRNLRPGVPKTDWPPCARCEDADGPMGTQKTPMRISGSRFGIEGSICRRCYGALQERERRQRHSLTRRKRTSA